MCAGPLGYPSKQAARQTYFVFDLSEDTDLHFYWLTSQADFMKQPFEDESFDAVYEIDATCHAPDQVSFQLLNSN